MANEPKGRRNPPAWPTLEEQLATSKVIHGSALEKLIRDNQDFHILRLEEAHDKLRLPPWLRVYWRKLHPDAVYSGASGGYPMILRELGEWMVEHQDLTPEPGQVTDTGPTTPSTGGSSQKGGPRGN
jgi:hypothetical protein